MTALMRTVRRQRAQTLDELAAVTGLTKSYLSKVERGRSTPSVSAAIKIARALDVDVARLFSDDPTAASLTVERAADHAGGRSHAIAATMLGKAMAPFVVRPGTRFTTHPHAAASGHATHPGQEFLFVHRGRVELDHDGRITALDAGDCAYFDASVPHGLRRVGDESAEVVVVTYDEPRRT
ncbi:putative transcription regulator protein [Mycolicibacterium insubricum]|jgi:transcriptional regulator with XRE-family HTH domain|uniref:DNA-binding protein n=1 Tax=Mycolicibacterium insubricum TaxID=444597 RepID=A0A1X0DB91_9MYCO|nr:XRE family transcriptional regulator [Mycolicibacterium insubricum]MCB9440767.1 helix-turn-helix transcriptional regulator [Mycolicibacterium sp.]MCV7083559.1 helix-turn-helix transcriptional regulator [Mycolicibacterium insubricum]ORA69641.1 DNA-binding protein [Mycolicibacterium insubricum]BBZ65713.1 putative transcription regulator protein [Mycolicibacterium insubricum]